MSIASRPAEARVYLENISWETYMSIVATGEQSGRIAYDRGVLEIMSPSKIHEQIRWLIGRMIEAFAEEAGVDICVVGSTTFCRQDLQRGVEADECYYIDHVDLIRGKDEIDLTTDPAPDLAVEVDISRTSTGKLDIYAALGVGEVWRYRSQELEIHVLAETGSYRKSGSSALFPEFPVQTVTEVLRRCGRESEAQLVRQFRTSLGKPDQ